MKTGGGFLGRTALTSLPLVHCKLRDILHISTDITSSSKRFPEDFFSPEYTQYSFHLTRPDIAVTLYLVTHRRKISRKVPECTHGPLFLQDGLVLWVVPRCAVRCCRVLSSFGARPASVYLPFFLLEQLGSESPHSNTQQHGQYAIFSCGFQ